MTEPGMYPNLSQLAVTVGAAALSLVILLGLAWLLA